MASEKLRRTIDDGINYDASNEDKFMIVMGGHTAIDALREWAKVHLVGDTIEMSREHLDIAFAVAKQAVKKKDGWLTEHTSFDTRDESLFNFGAEEVLSTIRAGVR